MRHSEHVNSTTTMQAASTSTPVGARKRSCRNCSVRKVSCVRTAQDGGVAAACVGCAKRGLA